MRATEFISEEWSAKYKRSINCASPKGFSQKAHCAGRNKNEDLNEFAPGGNSASSYYAVTANFVNEFTQQKQEEIQDLIDAGWTKQDLAQAGTQEGAAADIAHFEQVRDGFLKGLKPGFDAYLQGDTQMKDQLGEYWIDNDLPLNQDWEKIYGEPWGDDGEFDEDLNESINENATQDAWAAGYQAFQDDVNKCPYAPGSEQAREWNLGWESAQARGWGNVSEAAETDVAFEIDSEDAYNAVLDRFGSVIEWSGDYMVAPRRYWGAIQEVAYDNGSEATEAGDEQLDELSFLGSQCTKDCSGHRAGYEWSKRKGGVDSASWSPSFNKGAWLHNNGF